MHDTDHNNGNSRANTYFSLPNHTYEELERSINAYKKDMQSKFKTVLKTTVVANILPTLPVHIKLLFLSWAMLHFARMGHLFGEWGECVFPASPKLQVSFLLGYHLSSQMSLGKDFFSSPSHLHWRTLHFVLWNSYDFYTSVCMVNYSCPYNSLILVSIESASQFFSLYLSKNIELFSTAIIFQTVNQFSFVSPCEINPPAVTSPVFLCN